MKTSSGIRIINPAELLVEAWIDREMKLREKAEIVLTHNNPSWAMADAIKQCRVELQKAFKLTQYHDHTT